MMELNRGNLLCLDKPDFLYRSADSIREDISVIRDKIGEVKRSFSIRELLLSMLSEPYEKKPSEWLYDLEALLSEAECAYRKLSELREELSFLEAELGEAKCRIRI